MERNRRVVRQGVAVAGIAAAALTAAGLGLTPAAAAETSTCGSTFSTMTSPDVATSGRDTHLRAVTDAGTTGAWAVGGSYDTTYNPGTPAVLPVVMRWTGSAWQLGRAAALPVGQVGELHAVDGTTGRDVWAVGMAGYAAMVQRFDGTSWKRVGAPAVGSSSELLGVSARTATDAWAVGSATVDGRSVQLALHWDGRSWTRSALPALGAGELRSVVALAADDVWAVGRAAAAVPGGVEALALHFDGRAWTRVATAGAAGSSLTSITGTTGTTGTTVWAVGASATRDAQGNPVSRPVVQRWDGRVWRTAHTATDVNGRFSGVLARSATDVWAVGAAGSPYALRLTAGGWTRVAAPAVGVDGGAVYSAASVGGRVLAVGEQRADFSAPARSLALTRCDA